jgi:CheY-like chemotaxis protein
MPNVVDHFETVRVRNDGSLVPISLTVSGNARNERLRPDRSRPSFFGCARIREIAAAAVTAFARSDDRGKALRSGFPRHLAKPIDSSELMGAVAGLAKRGRLGEYTLRCGGGSGLARPSGTV